MIHNRAFRGELANGHAIVAFLRDSAHAGLVREGQTVRVRMSPFDMSTGEIILDAQAGAGS